MDVLPWKLNRKCRNRRQRCNCGGYSFPHRTLSPACYFKIEGWRQASVAELVSRYSGAPGPDVPF